MKTQKHKLILRKQTITELSENELLNVNGGTTAGCAMLVLSLGLAVMAATQAVIDNAAGGSDNDD